MLQRPPALERFAAPAWPSRALWRLALGTLLLVAVYAGFVLGLMALLWWRAPAEAVGLSAPTRPGPTLLLLASFCGMILAAAVALRALHRRGLGSLLGPRRRMARDFVRAAGATLAVYAPALLLWGLVHDSLPGLAPGLWLLLLPATLAGVALQTLAEEMVFRGYLLQQLGARFRSGLAWLVLPALLFGLVHYAPGASGFGTAWPMALAGAFGLAAGDLTARTGSLGAAWGLHFANNLVAIGLLGTQGTITGLALRLTPYGIDEPGAQLAAAADLALLALAWALCRRLTR